MRIDAPVEGKEGGAYRVLGVYRPSAIGTGTGRPPASWIRNVCPS